MKHSLGWIGVMSSLMIPALGAAGEDGPAKIQDNSFLLEEAYNQEDGVVQHIQTFQRMKDDGWAYGFTQEWPVPTQAHQLSYVIPVLHFQEGGGDTGLGDILINYRYQLFFDGPVALAPRFSLLLPSGDYKKGFGNGVVGYQINWPLSVELGDRFVTHWNLGATCVPGAKGPEEFEADVVSFNYGASVIWLATPTFNLMLEAVGASEEARVEDEEPAESASMFLNPGMRAAYNTDFGLQIVPGLAAPIGIGPSADEYGIFLYLSLEHPLF